MPSGKFGRFGRLRGHSRGSRGPEVFEEAAERRLRGEERHRVGVRGVQRAPGHHPVVQEWRSHHRE